MYNNIKEEQKMIRKHILIEDFNEGDEQSREDLIGYLLSHDWGYRIFKENEE